MENTNKTPTSTNNQNNKHINIGIVLSNYYYDLITKPMLDKATEGINEAGATLKQVIEVPGCFDIPLATKKLLEQEEINAVITLGAVVQGSTDHDKVIAYALSKQLMELSLEYNKPVVLGVNGPKMTKEQAIERIPRSKDVAIACVQMVNNLK